MKFPKKLQHKLNERIENGILRTLTTQKNTIDFASNDYLGFAKSETIFNKTHQYLLQENLIQNGATGSRLLSGNSKLYEVTETQIATFHNAETALLFNSGYDANIGFFSAVLQRGDVILYDEYIHASIRDGITMSNAKSYKFKHNDLKNLQKKINTISKKLDASLHEIYIVTESVFSMDGDTPNLTEMIQYCKQHHYHLIVDEAHALGVCGKQGEGIVQQLQLENDVFARINTFGKALGCHGAVVLGSSALKNYLINFARSFIYTTGLSPHAVATIKIAYDELQKTGAVAELQNRVQTFKKELQDFNFIPSNSAIQSFIIQGNKNVKKAAKILQSKGFDVKPIVPPTVPKGKERLRFCLHEYNTEEEIQKLRQELKKLVLQHIFV